MRALVVVLMVGACSGQISGDPAPEGTPSTPGPSPSRPGMSLPPDAPAPTAPPTVPAPVEKKSCLLPARVWKLGPTQYANTVRALFPGLTLDPAGALAATLPPRERGFSSPPDRLDMSQTHVDELVAKADEIATAVAADPAKLAPCLGRAPVDAACVRSFVESFGTRAFRRPPEKEEVDALAAVYAAEAAASDARSGLQQLVRAILVSTPFLYRTELGDRAAAPGTVVRLTGYERAAALSYFLLDGPPDAALLDAAAKGRLDTAAGLETEARRLLASPARGLLRYFDEHLDTDLIVSPLPEKDAKLFPDWSLALAQDMARETTAFAEELLWRGDAKLASLFTAEWSVVNDRLGRIYGVTGAKEFKRIALPPGQRAGYLTQGTVLARFAYTDGSDPVHRGQYVREQLLCLPTPPPPPDVNAVPPKADRVLTGRERISRHSADPTCATCHVLMDPMGFALESFDGVGRHRTMEVGKPIDTTGTLHGVEGGPKPFRNAAELGQVLSTLPQARTCFARKLAAFGAGQTSGAECHAGRVAARLEATGNIIDAVVAMVAHDDFFLRLVPAN